MNMEYRQVVAITGLGGLFQLVGTKKDGALVKSLIDDSVKFISARVHQLTPLESIEIYTYGDNVRLHEVFETMKENDKEVASLNAKKDIKAIKAYFKSVLPTYDEDRVYVSDIKKVLKWYELLKTKDLLNFEYLKTNEEDANEEETVVSSEEEKASE